MRTRALLCKLVGMRLGRSVLLAGLPQFSGDPRRSVTIGDSCYFNTDVYFDTNASVTLGNRVSIGQRVVFITSDHRINGQIRRCGSFDPQSIVVEDGVWIGARSTILPGVRIGQGAVVAAGALVSKDVPANTLVGGVPARIIRYLDTNDESQES